MPDLTSFNPFDWYWIVGGDESRFWSSADACYVDILPEGATPTRITSEQELCNVLAVYGLLGPGAFKALEPWQFRAMLDIGGVRAAVEAAIAAIPDAATKAVAQAKLEYALSFHRDDPLISMLAPAVGLTDDQIDALWRQAAQLWT